MHDGWPDRLAPLAAGGLLIGLVSLHAAHMSSMVWFASLGALAAIGVLAVVVAHQRRQMIVLAGSVEQRMQQLHHQARHDALTDLPNRAYFMERLEEAMQRSRTSPDEQFAILFIDCDDFKLVNDSYGHAVGDAVLRVLARRLRSALRAEDIAARLGGDEFALLLHPMHTPDRARQVIQRLKTLFADSYVLSGISMHVNVSIGLALSSTGYERSADMLHDADVSMYAEKGAVPPPAAGPAERGAMAGRSGAAEVGSGRGLLVSPERRAPRRAARPAPHPYGELVLVAPRHSGSAAVATAPASAPADAAMGQVLADIDVAVGQIEHRVQQRRAVGR